jgi:hypothetical protein
VSSQVLRFLAPVKKAIKGHSLSKLSVHDLGSMLWSQFSAIFDNFRRKNWRFLKNQCYGQIFATSSMDPPLAKPAGKVRPRKVGPSPWSQICLESKTPIFSLKFSAKIFKNHNIGPWRSPTSSLLTRTVFFMLLGVAQQQLLR